MASQGQKYRPGVNRAITKKWAEAKAINYDDWDDSDGYDPEEPVQTAPVHGRQQSWDTRSQGASSQRGYAKPPSQYNPSNRSVTGPTITSRTSFDRGDDRRHFTNTGGAQGPYPTAQRDPFEETQPEYDPYSDAQMRGHRGLPPLQLQTGGRPLLEQQRQYQQGPYAQGPYSAGSGDNHFQDSRRAPFAEPVIGPSGRQSQSSGRPTPSDMYPRGESPLRPGSQNSHGGSPSRAFPPRKSSLSQQQISPEIPQYAAMSAASVAQASTPASEDKALPFIRPADIYRRMEEEKEKERRSQESSRPSIDSASNRNREGPMASHRTGTEPVTDSPSKEAVEEPDTTRRLQPALPPVAERKSEYGFDNMVQDSNSDQPSAILNRTDTGLTKASAASSDYTNRPDPTSASTLNSRRSPFSSAESPYEAFSPAAPTAPFLLPAVRGVSDFGNMFRQDSIISSERQPPLSTTAASPHEESVEAATSPGSNLQHQKSVGYRSMVEQAFDQSQEQVPPTPVSGSDSIGRSNSASASDISPIISKTYQPPESQPTISEEESSRPGTSSTQKSLGRSMDKELPHPPAIVPGYRRDSSPASTHNSHERPVSIVTSVLPKGEFAIPSSATSSTASWDKDSERSPVRENVPLVANEPAARTTGDSTNLDKPSDLSRTPSEDWRNWEKSQKQFKTQHGVHDSVPSTPGIPSPISSGESPPKGTVRDIASKLERHSDTSTPANVQASQSTVARLDSFRPSIPGGWQSYTTNTGTATPQHEGIPNDSQPLQAAGEEDYPRAGPPKDHSAFIGTSKGAFEALAASGSALAGAFGMTQVVKEQSRARDSMTDTSRTSTPSSSHEHEASQSRLGPDHQAESIQQSGSPWTASHLAPMPLPKDTPSEADAGHSTLGYFPAPLAVRQSPNPEQPTPQRPALAPALSTNDSPHDDDNDRLRKEIVKSLTPNSSRFEGSSALLPGQDDSLVPSESQRPVSSVEDNLPSEYDYYWDQINQESSRDFEASTPYAPPVPETKAVSNSAETNLPPKTTLEERFSWEVAGGQTPPVPNMNSYRDSPQGQGSPDTIRAPTSAPLTASNSTPTTVEHLLSPEAVRPTPSAKLAVDKDLPSLMEARAPAAQDSTYPPMSTSSAFRELPVKEVLALSSPQERIQAFNIHRQHYATSNDGGLAQWLQSIGKSDPEYASVISGNGIPIVRDDGNEMYRPSPARLATKFRMPSSSFAGGSETSGTKQMQGDGKRLLQAGGKLGKKGGLAARGLLAKAKDKARAVSSSDKGVLQNRRRSSQFDATPANEIQHSSYSSVPPQIPALNQKLDLSPVDHDDWSLPYDTPRDNKKPDAEHTRSSGIERGIVTSHVGGAQPAAKYESPREEAKTFAAPAPFIGQIIPNNEERGAAFRNSTLSTTESPKTNHQTLNALEEAHADRMSTPHESRIPLAIAASVPLVGAATLDKHLASGRPDVKKPNSLSAPQDWHSTISDASSSAPNPVDMEDNPRSISPPRRSMSNAIDAENVGNPTYTQHFPPTKTAEAEQDRAQAATAQDRDQLPTYEQPVVPTRVVPSRLGESPQIIPVADLSSKRRNEDRPVLVRPFSFAEPDARERVVPETTRSSAAGETRNKQSTQDSLDEKNDSSHHARNRRSFHRSCGPPHAPSIDEHPAFRSSDPVDGSGTLSTESPLPSAQRAHALPVPGQRCAKCHLPITSEGEGGFSIPVDTRQGQNQSIEGPFGPSGTTESRTSQGDGQPKLAVLYARDMGPPQQRSENDRSKSRTFGGLFKREKSHIDEQNMLKPNQKERPNGFFANRQSSVSSQGSRLGSLRQSPSRATQNSREAANQRRSSRDLLQRSAGDNNDESERKKRFSGIGGFFRKDSSLPQESNTWNTQHGNMPMQQSAYQDSRRQQQQQQQQQQQSPRQQQAQYATRQVPGSTLSERPANKPHGSSDGTFRAPSFPHGPDSVMPGRGDSSSRLDGPSQDRGFVQNPTGAYSAAPQAPEGFNPPTQGFGTSTPPVSGMPSASASKRAIDLHKRSRSPKLGRRSPSEELTPGHAADPATNLGTFSSKVRAPHHDPDSTGDVAQEKPWAISLPAAADAEEHRPSKELQRSESAGNRGIVAELPGSKANGYESEEEIVMSATAMPGDQWMPDAMDYAYGRFDD